MSPTEDNLLTPAELARALGANRSAITNWRDPNPKPPRRQRLNQEGKPFPDPVRVEQVEGKRPKEYFDFKQVKAWVDSLEAAPGKVLKSGFTQFRVGPDVIVAAAAVSLSDSPNATNLIEAVTSVVALAAFAHRATVAPITLQDALSRADEQGLQVQIDWHVTGTVAEEAAFKTILEAYSSWERPFSAEDGWMDVFDAALDTHQHQRWQDDMRTPDEAAELAGLLAAVDESVNSVLDLSAGSLGMLCATGAELQHHRGLRLVAQDSNPESLNIGLKRAFIAGVKIAETRAVASSLADSYPSNDQFDLVIADAPRIKPDSDDDKPTMPMSSFGENHGEWILATPPPADEQIAWLEIALAKTAPAGRSVLLMYADSPWRRGRAAEVRGELLKRGQLEAVIALPYGLRRSSRVSYVMWVLRGTARTEALGNPDPLLINARGARVMPGRGRKAGRPGLSQGSRSAWVRHSAEAYSAWINDREVLQLPQLNVATVAATDFIRDPDVNLDPEIHTAPKVDAAAAVSAADQLKDAGITLSAILERASAEAARFTGLAGLDDVELRWTNLGELHQAGQIELTRGALRLGTETTDAESMKYEVITPRDIREPGSTEPEFIFLPSGAHARQITQPDDVVFSHMPRRCVARVEPVGGRVVSGFSLSIARIVGNGALDLGLTPETLAFFLNSSRNERQVSGTSWRLNPLELEVPLITGAGAERLRALITELQTLRTAAQELGLEIDKAASALDVLIAAKSA